MHWILFQSSLFCPSRQVVHGEGLLYAILYLCNGCVGLRTDYLTVPVVLYSSLCDGYKETLLLIGSRLTQIGGWTLLLFHKEVFIPIRSTGFPFWPDPPLLYPPLPVLSVSCGVSSRKNNCYTRHGKQNGRAVEKQLLYNVWWHIIPRIQWEGG